MNVEECLAEGLLKKTDPDRKKALRSLELSAHKIEIAKRELKAGIYENVVISAYTSMFHSARALLYRDGYKERSHYAIFVYLNEKYTDKMERRYLHEFNSLRMERHELMYGLEKLPEILKAEAESVVEIAEGFLEQVKKILS